MRLLVTGGAGFIGSNFVHFWMKRHPGDEITVLDKLTHAGQQSNLASLESKPGFRFLQGDILDQSRVEALLRDQAIDTVVNFAAETHVDRSILDPDVFIDNNIQGTHSLLNAARRVWGKEHPGKQFLQISTDEVYGELPPKAAAFTEDSPYAPSSPYAASKAAADHLVRAYARSYGLRGNISLCTNNYGPYQWPEKFIPLVICHCLTGQSIPIYGDGKQVRDWLYVEDHCLAIELILMANRTNERWNIGGHVQATNSKIARGICRSLDERFQADAALADAFPESPAGSGSSCLDLITHVTDRPGHDRRYALSCHKIADQLGFRPTVGMHCGLQQTIDWYLANPAWWRPLLASRKNIDWGAAN